MMKKFSIGKTTEELGALPVPTSQTADEPAKIPRVRACQGDQTDMPP